MLRLIVLIPVVGLLAACGTKDVPARLSCFDGDRFPSTWEDGTQHFNFTGGPGPVWTNAVTRRMFIGRFSRSDNAVTVSVESVLHLSGRIEPATGGATLRVSDTSGADRFHIEFTRTSPSLPGSKDVRVLKCLGMNA